MDIVPPGYPAYIRMHHQGRLLWDATHLCASMLMLQYLLHPDILRHQISPISAHVTGHPHIPRHAHPTHILCMQLSSVTSHIARYSTTDWYFYPHSPKITYRILDRYTSTSDLQRYAIAATYLRGQYILVYISMELRNLCPRHGIGHPVYQNVSDVAKIPSRILPLAFHGVSSAVRDVNIRL